MGRKQEGGQEGRWLVICILASTLRAKDFLGENVLERGEDRAGEIDFSV